MTVRELITELERQIREFPEIEDAPVRTVDDTEDIAVVCLHDTDGEGFDYVTIEPV